MKILAPQSPRGFTLFELVLAMIISGLLVTSVMKLADATIRSTRLTVDTQNEQITKDAFFTMMRRHFGQLPGNARMELTFVEQGGASNKQYLSDLTFQNVPTAFNWGGTPISAEAMRLTTIPVSGGFLDLVIQYFDEPILDSDESLAERGIEPIASISLVSNIRLCEWRAVSGSGQAFPIDWDDPDVGLYQWESGQLPTQVELNIAFGANGEVIRRVFWIPKRENPKQATGVQSR